MNDYEVVRRVRMSDQPRHPLMPGEILTLPHSALCDAGRVTWVPASDNIRWVRASTFEPGYYQPTQPPCTCGAGLLRLMAGGR